ncbi:hypothetical protein QFC24_003830 [Naganishia onofrii]|uniref:Uncharacterized protein n=1 Tax=Naganishia onofrii TaxID=1851511 RepID=A0ACC2XJQ7_9TREE|nr:hypothetical protein QFC24_003830 [Naganishia onofrii]
MSRLTLAQQLKQLESAAPIQEADPEHAYSSLGTYNPRQGEEEDDGDDEARAHYGDVGTSTLRDPTLSTLSHLDAKYNSASGSGKQQQHATKKVKVFDDDLSEDEDEERIFAGEDGLDGSGSEDDDEDEGDDDEESGDDDEDDDEDEEDDDEEDDESENNGSHPITRHSLSAKTNTTTAATANGNASAKLDPVAAIRASKNKEVEKGRAILRQQKLFDDLVAVRISFAKAWQAGSKVPVIPPPPQTRAGKRNIDDVDSDSEEEAASGLAEALDAMNATLADNRAQMLRRLHSLSEDLFSVRERIGRALPGMSDVGGRGAGERERKRRKFDEDVEEEEKDDVIGYETYWKSCADDSFALLDSSHDTLVTTLNKWSTKIQAASIQQATLAGKTNGNKFSATSAGTGVLEAIDGSLNAKATEEQFYKSLLREVIEARAGGTGGSGIDVSHLRSEKKKKRDAERGASKGRRIRYTVHEKAQNFTVPTPLETTWGTEQIDELFTSLLGGAGMEGAGADQDDRGVMGAVVDGDAGLGGLRVF